MVEQSLDKALAGGSIPSSPMICTHSSRRAATLITWIALDKCRVGVRFLMGAPDLLARGVMVTYPALNGRDSRFES